ncbi:hypothetical protein [Peribacillus asahii]|uniref:hypothetical protein n=1 Tax=Peribacillus asahii TaxID=228899 RepID=UPI0020795FC1|nr:hypothetical protein [Peribacillus asahii]USK71139.1 hypothetical protein LIS76_05085 [Peribacillus asahii]
MSKLKVFSSIFNFIEKMYHAIHELFWLFFIFILFPLVTIVIFISGWDYMNEGETLTGIGLYSVGVVFALVTVGFIYGTVSEHIDKLKQRNK